MRARRDPEARRRLIVEAAAAVISEDGMQALSHRRVAARAKVPLGSTTQYFDSLDELRAEGLALLATWIDDDLARLRTLLDEGGPENIATVLAKECREFTKDPDRLRTEAAFYVASMQNPELRPLATRWFDGLCLALTATMDEHTARLVAVLVDGDMMYASLHDTPLDETDLADAISRLIEGSDV